MAGLALTLFGAPQIELDDRPLRMDRQKSLALLVYLAVDGQPHRRDTLAALFWPDADQEHARSSLRRVLSSLHITLHHRWLSIDDTISLLAAQDLWIDVARFRQLLAISQSCTDGDRVAALDEAATLYRGDFLSGFSLPDCPEFEDWQRTVADNLRCDLAAILNQLSADYATVGERTAAIRVARRWVGIDPFHEAAQVRLIELYAADGQFDAARRQYEQFAQLLETEIGVAPALTTADLYRSLQKRAVPTLVDPRPSKALTEEKLPAAQP